MRDGRRRGGAGRALRESVRWTEVARTPYGILPALVTGLLSFVLLLDYQAFTIAGPDIAQDLNLDLRIIAGIFQVVGIISIVAQLAVAWLSDRTRRTPLVAGGTIAAGLMSMAQGRAQSSAGYTVPRTAGTVADLFSGIPTFSLVADWYPIRVRGRVFALLGMSTSLGGVIALPLVGLLLTATGWRTTVVVLGAAVAVIGIGYLFLPEPVRGYFEKKEMGLDEDACRLQDPPQSFGEAWRTTWSIRTLRRTFVAQMLFELGIQPFVLFLPFFLAERYGVTTAGRGAIFGAAAAAGLLGGYIGGGLVDVFGRRSPGGVLRIMAVFFAFGLAGLVLAATGPALWLEVTGFCILRFGASLAGPGLGSVYSQIVPPAIRAQALQVIGLAALPSFIFVGVFGIVQRTYGFETAFLTGVPLTFLGTLVLASAGDLFAADRRNALLASTAKDDAAKRRAEGRSKLLICRGVDVAYGSTQVLFGVDLEIEEGEIVALLGTNGAGKSTLLRAIGGTQEASGGAIVLDGRDITHMPPHEIVSLGVVQMPGGRAVFGGLTVRENLELAAWLEPDRTRELVEEVYAAFPRLRARGNVPAGALSGGEQQMVGLAQAFIARPRLLLIDELTLGLSPAVVAELLDRVRAINERGTTVVVVEQSVTVALRLARRAVFMEKGEVRFTGATQDLLRRPDILRAVYVRGTAELGAGPAAPAPERARTVLEVRGLTKRYGGVTALDGVDLDLPAERIVGIVGPNGSGKTTLFDVISGHQTADEGSVVLGGVDVTAMPPHERARRGLVRRFQDARLFDRLTVSETLLVALDRSMEVRSAALGAIGVPAARRSERRVRAQADRLVDLLELGAYRDTLVAGLSTGVRRIVDLAFVLARRPDVLLLDEPSSGVAASEAIGLGALIRRIRRETGCAILVVEHDMPLLVSVADELVALVAGSVVARGDARDVLDDPDVSAAFLGGADPLQTGRSR